MSTVEKLKKIMEIADTLSNDEILLLQHTMLTDLWCKRIENKIDRKVND